MKVNNPSWLYEAQKKEEKKAHKAWRNNRKNRKSVWFGKEEN